MPKVLAAIIALLLATTPAWAGPALEDLLAATPRIQTLHSHGTGVVIAPGLILTAYHVVHGYTNHTIKAVFANGKRCPVTLRSLSGDDLAVLTYSPACNPVVRPVPLACRSVHWGEAVRAIGNPLMIENALMFGYVMSTTPDQDGLVPLNLPEMPGMSGGPVFDAGGSLLGITDAMAMLPGEVDDGEGNQIANRMVPLTTGIGLMIPSFSFCDEIRAEYLK